MCVFTIYYVEGVMKKYKVKFDPWPTWGMLRGLAEAMLGEKGGSAVKFNGPNGLSGLIKR